MLVGDAFQIRVHAQARVGTRRAAGRQDMIRARKIIAKRNRRRDIAPADPAENAEQQRKRDEGARISPYSARISAMIRLYTSSTVMAWRHLLSRHADSRWLYAETHGLQ